MHASVRLACFFAISALLLGIAAADGQPLLTPPTLPSTTADTTPLEPSPTEPAGDKRTENTRLLRLAQRKVETNAADNAAAQQVAHFQSVDAVFAQQDVVEQQIKDLDRAESWSSKRNSIRRPPTRLRPAKPTRLLSSTA